MNFNNPEDFSSSPQSGSSENSDDTGSQAFVTADEADSSDSEDKDLVEDESTVMAIDNDDITAQSALSARSGSSTGSSDRLEEALRQAANQARTQGIEYDEHGDITMEMADDEITGAFQPSLNGDRKARTTGVSSALRDQENVNPFSPAFRSGVRAQNDEETGDTMDFTRAAGSILPVPVDNSISCNLTNRKPKAEGTRRSYGGVRRLSGASSMSGDETMELTTAIGTIQNDQRFPFQLNNVPGQDTSRDEDDEESTMEFTSVVGGVLEKGSVQRNFDRQENSRRSIASSISEEDMDMTTADGGILSSITERTEPLEDQTLDMDITQAVGAILPQQLSAVSKIEAKALIEREMDVGQPPADPFYDGPRDSSFASHHDVVQGRNKLSGIGASELGNVTISPKGKHPRRSLGTRPSITPKDSSQLSTPTKGAAKVTTPSKHLNQQVGPRPTTPGKTPPSKNINLRTASPKKLFEAEIGKAISPPKPAMSNTFFQQDPGSGVQAPVILKPRRRRSSGLGVDKEGLGSPLVTELLARRGSIGQSAQPFVSHPNGKVPNSVRFEDPRAIEQEIEQERAEDERKESRRGILQREADSQDTEEKDATANLKDMIQSLTPQKKKLKNRKSLHVGAAKGLLGKRPVELDEDNDDEDTIPKRLKGREGSPVKKIKLPAPSPKIETAGRTLRSARLSLAGTMGNARITTPLMGTSPLKGGRATTPKDQQRFKDMDARKTNDKPVVSLNQKMEGERLTAMEPLEKEDRIHLQDFLNMTSIRFMELTTTKRRLTTAPNGLGSAKKREPLGLAGKEQSVADTELESCVVAGACTVPMLDLYQHVSVSFHSQRLALKLINMMDRHAESSRNI